MSNSAENIIRMSNDIANFWKYYPLSEAKECFAEHVNKYWEPSMRKTLHELIKEDSSRFAELVNLSIELINCNYHNPIKSKLKDYVGGG